MAIAKTSRKQLLRLGNDKANAYWLFSTQK